MQCDDDQADFSESELEELNKALGASLPTYENPGITITTRSSDGNALVQFLREELDPDYVLAVPSDWIQKSVVPRDLFIEALSSYVLWNFLFEPLLGPIKEKWK